MIILSVFVIRKNGVRVAQCFKLKLQVERAVMSYSFILRVVRTLLLLCTVSQKMSHLWLVMNGFWYFFGRNVTDKVSNHKMLYYATSNNLCYCTAWQNGETRKLHFHSNAVLVHCLNSTSCLISSVFLTHDSYSHYCMTP